MKPTIKIGGGPVPMPASEGKRETANIFSVLRDKKLFLLIIVALLIISISSANVNDYSSTLVFMGHMNQTAGSPTTFVDSSPYLKTITPVGSVITTTSVKQFGNASAYFDGSGDRLTMTDSASWNFGSGNFTIHALVRMAAYPSVGQTVGTIISQRVGSTDDSMGVYVTSSGTVEVDCFNSANQVKTISGSAVLGTSALRQIDIIRSGNTGYLYVDGVANGTVDLTGFTLTDSSGLMVIGDQQRGSYTLPINAYIDELAIWKGTAVPIADLYPQTGEIYAVPHANFLKNTTEIRYPLSLQFTDTTEGIPTTWNWSFGDGNTSTAQNPTFTYTIPGVYTVSLNATNSLGFSNTTKSKFVVLPSMGYAMTKITASAPMTAQWSRGTTVMNDTIYVVGGVKSGGTNANGEVWSSTNGVTWSELNASAFPARHGAVMTTYNNLIWVIGGYDGVSQYIGDVWSSPDGVIWTQKTSSPTFGKIFRPTVLTYNNTMWLLGGDLSTGSVSNSVYSSTDGVTWDLVTATPAWSARYGAGGTVYDGKMWIVGGVHTESSATSLRDVWYSTDGSSWTRATSDAGFGRYTADMAVADGLMWTFGGASGNIAPFYYYPDLHVSADGATWYNTTYTSAVTGNWTENGFVNLSGTLYVVGGINPDAITSENVVWKLDTVNGNPPISSFTANATTGTIPLAILFNDTSTITPTSWKWNYTTSTNSTPYTFATSQNPTYTFTSAGNYSVILTATNGYGSNTTPTATWINVTALPWPEASFSANRTMVIPGESIAFTDSSTQTPTSWSWSFGDGTLSTLQNPSHTYTTSGTYTVSLTASNYFGSNTSVRTGYISVGATPIVSFHGSAVIGAVPLNVTFSDSSIDATAWAWDFNNDGVIDSTQQNPVFSFSTPGTYTVSLTATNAYGANATRKINYVVASSVVEVATPAVGSENTRNIVVTGGNINISSTETSGWVSSWYYNAPDDERIGIIELDVPLNSHTNITLYYGNGRYVEGWIVYTPVDLINSFSEIHLGDEYYSETYSETFKDSHVAIGCTASAVCINSKIQFSSYAKNLTATPTQHGFSLYAQGYGLYSSEIAFYPVSDIGQNLITGIAVTSDKDVFIYVQNDAANSLAQTVTLTTSEAVHQGTENVFSTFMGYLSSILGAIGSIGYWLKFFFIDNLIMVVVLYIMGTLSAAIASEDLKGNPNPFNILVTFFRFQAAFLRGFVWMWSKFVIMLTLLVQAVMKWL